MDNKSELVSEPSTGIKPVDATIISTGKEQKVVMNSLPFDSPKDVAIAIAGSIDAGKSSFIGVLFSGKLDNGNGSARATVAKHPHEITSGRTSDISTRVVSFDMKVMNEKKEIVTERVTRILVDLCGHEKYLKTTTFGMTGHFPDYATVIVAANRGILPMTKEHLRILFYMRIPVIIVITHVDMLLANEDKDIAPPKHIYDNTVKGIKLICADYGKKPAFLNNSKDITLSEEELRKNEAIVGDKMPRVAETISKTTDIVPVISMSNTTGYYVEPIKRLIGSLKPRKLWDATTLDGSVFYIDTVFNPPGIGMVLSGIVKGKPIHDRENLWIGPLGKEFTKIRVRSMHNNLRQDTNKLEDQQRGCICIASLDKHVALSRQNVNKRMVVISSEAMKNNICFRFIAKIEILHHPTTIKCGYSAVIHANTISSTARLVEIVDGKNTTKDKQIEGETKNETETKEPATPGLRTSDKATVIFKFKYAAQFVEPGTTFFFSEGSTKGVGEIIDTIPLEKDPDARPDPARSSRSRRRIRGGQNKKPRIKTVPAT